MTTSGTTTFSVSRDDIVQDVLESLAVLQDGETASANDLITVGRSINLLVKAMAIKGIPIWAIQTTPIPLVVALASYLIGPGLVAPNVAANRPSRVYQAYIQDSQTNSWPLTQISKQEYDYLSRKATPGIPNQFYYEPLLDSGKLWVYPVVNLTGYTAYISSQRALYDMTTGAQTFDLPQECYLMMKWVTAREVMSKYVVPSNIAQMVYAEAERWENPSWDFEQEEASTMFSPLAGSGNNAGYFGG